MSNKQAGLDEQVKQLEDAIRKRDATNEGGEVRFLCPSHDDNNPSARWNPEKLVWCCDACGAGGSWRDLFMELGLGELATTTSNATIHSIRDANGAEVAEHRRTDFEDDSKTFAWYRNGTPGLKGLKVAELPLYGTEALTQADPDELIYVTEGEKAADALRRHTLFAVGTVTGAKGAPSASVLEVLTGRDVVLLPDNDDPGRAHMQRVAQAAHPLARRVRVLELPNLPEKGDAADWVGALESEGKNSEDICYALDGLVDTALDWSPPENGDEEPTCEGVTTKEKESKKLINLASDAELFHTPALDTFATIPVDDHNETHHLQGGTFRRWLSLAFYLREKKPPSAQAVLDARGILDARAQFNGPTLPVHYRVGTHEDNVYLDLGNRDWQAVKVTPKGWEIVDDPPVKFWRPAGMLPLPHPEQGGSIEDLRPFLNVPDNEAFVLTTSFLVGALSPKGPYPLLILLGEPGSAKSTAAKIIRSLLDPYKAPLRTLPRTEQDLLIAATGSWILVFDNLSHIRDFMSDALCRLATEGGFATRKLYTDRDEIIFEAERPVILTGIDSVATRSDLLDRAILVTLNPIDEKRRLAMAELWSNFLNARPRILGALLDACSAALKHRNEVQLDILPRMADFAIWNVAAEPALPWEPGSFLAAYEGARSNATEIAIDADPVAVATVLLIDKVGEQETTATDLLYTLEQEVSETITRTKSWPKSASSLSGRLRRVAPLLRRQGYEVEFLPRQGNRRPIILRRIEDFAESGSAKGSEFSSAIEGGPSRRHTVHKSAEDAGGSHPLPFHKPNLEKLKQMVEDDESSRLSNMLACGEPDDDPYIPE